MGRKSPKSKKIVTPDIVVVEDTPKLVEFPMKSYISILNRYRYPNSFTPTSTSAKKMKGKKSKNQSSPMHEVLILSDEELSPTKSKKSHKRITNADPSEIDPVKCFSNKITEKSNLNDSIYASDGSPGLSSLPLFDQSIVEIESSEMKGNKSENQLPSTREVVPLRGEELSATKSRKSSKRITNADPSEKVVIADTPQNNRSKTPTAGTSSKNLSVLPESSVNDSVKCFSNKRTEKSTLNFSNDTSGGVAELSWLSEFDESAVDVENSKPVNNNKQRKCKVVNSSEAEHAARIASFIPASNVSNNMEVLDDSQQVSSQILRKQSSEGTTEREKKKKRKNKDKMSFKNNTKNNSSDILEASPSAKRQKIAIDDGPHSTLLAVTTQNGTDTVPPTGPPLDNTIVLSDDDDVEQDIIVLGIPAKPTIRNYRAIPRRKKKKSLSRFCGDSYRAPPVMPSFQQSYPESPVRLPLNVITTAIYELSKTKEGADMLAAANIQQPERGVFHFNSNQPAPSASLLPIPTNVYGDNIYNPSPAVKKGLRPIIIDGSNVAMCHGNGHIFSCKGLDICVNYFVERQHKVFAFIPRFRQHSATTKDSHLLEPLIRQNHLILTPSRFVDGRHDVPYDDRYIVQTAAELGGVIVSSDNYRDLLEENANWHETIKKRLLMFTWVEDLLIFPQDPLGKRGPTLDKFLRF